MSAGLLAAGALPRALLAETRAELLKMFRLPAYVLPSIAFPAVFYLVFGVSLGRGVVPGTGVNMAAYLLATYGTFGVVGAALFGLGVGVATERGQGWLTLKQASAMPAVAYFWAKVVLAMAFAIAIVLVLAIIAVTLGNVRLGMANWIALGFTLVLGAAPFCALGCALAFMAGPNSAAPVVNLIHLPMSLASGLWLPVELLPPLLRSLAPTLPPYHLARLALACVGVPSAHLAWHILMLAGFTLVFLMLAVVVFRRDQGKTYG